MEAVKKVGFLVAMSEEALGLNLAFSDLDAIHHESLVAFFGQDVNCSRLAPY
jgi:hypothetical protein